MNKVTVGVIVAILAVFGGIVAWSAINSGQKNDVSSYDEKKVVQVSDDAIAEHIRGKEDSEVVVIEYADLQCPGCASMMPRISELHETYGDRVAFVFRNYPISGHQNARSAAAAAESAGFQGYYWEMLETLYSNRSSWTSESGSTRTDAYVKLFQDIAPDGDVEEFKKGMSDERIERKITFDQNLGKKAGVDGTPSFFVNGEKVELAKDDTFDDFKTKIEDKIKAALK